MERPGPVHVRAMTRRVPQVSEEMRLAAADPGASIAEGYGEDVGALWGDGKPW